MKRIRLSMQDYELYPRGSNNERKQLGLPMIRRVYIFKERKKQWERFISKWNELGHPGPFLTVEELRGVINES